jgi:hypothetical protein
VASKLELPEGTTIYLVFHISLLKKKLSENIMTTINLPTLNHVGRVEISPIAILDRKLIKRSNRAVVMALI